MSRSGDANRTYLWPRPYDLFKLGLDHYGVRGKANDWFRSYLSNRSQFFSISSNKSSIKIIPHGVPQGSVLGPLLFLIYINDLHNAIFSSETFHFADDTHLLHFNQDLLSLCNRVNRDLRSLQTWLKANKISLNAGKTEFLIFRHCRKNLPFIPFLKIGGMKTSNILVFWLTRISTGKTTQHLYQLNSPEQMALYLSSGTTFKQKP